MARYIAGWNNPGYLPEMEPLVVHSFNDAKDFLIGATNAEASDCEYPQSWHELSVEIRQCKEPSHGFKLWERNWIAPNGECWWIRKVQ